MSSKLAGREPQLQQRAAQHYAAIPMTVTMDTIPEAVDQAFPGLQQWATEHRVTFDTWEAPDGAAWRSRFEQYITDPSKESDPSKWQTDIAYLIGEA